VTPCTIGIIIAGAIVGVPALAYLVAKMATLGRLQGEETYRDHIIRKLHQLEKEEHGTEPTRT
jgi:hypothetical protein